MKIQCNLLRFEILLNMLKMATLIDFLYVKLRYFVKYQKMYTFKMEEKKKNTNASYLLDNWRC